MSTPFLSIIIPAFNEETRLPGTLKKINDFLQTQAFSSEVLVVENGSRDHTYAMAADFVQAHTRSPASASAHVQFQAMHLEARGKGGAVRHGMLAARGDFRFMCDADLSMPIEQVLRFLPPKLDDYHIAIGSREALGSVRIAEPFYRHFGGRVINAMIRLLALPGFQDTQCGFKCFRAAIAEDLFGALTLTGWSFDIEILYIARRRGYRIVEVPIDWYFNPDSKLSLLRDTLKMTLDLLAVRRNARAGVYDAAIQVRS